MTKFIGSDTSKQELINHYEELRNLVLNKSKISMNGSLGYSILFFRGMVSWIKTCLSSELIYPSRSLSSLLENTENNAEKQIMIPHVIQEEATMILANIILSHQLQQESRNLHV